MSPGVMVAGIDDVEDGGSNVWMSYTTIPESLRIGGWQNMSSVLERNDSRFEMIYEVELSVFK